MTNSCKGNGEESRKFRREKIYPCNANTQNKTRANSKSVKDRVQAILPSITIRQEQTLEGR